MAADSADPPVVAVVVTCDPGDWFEETLACLGEQDHTNLSVLIVDAGSVADPAGRVAAALPRAFVHRLDRRVARGEAANEVLAVVEGASHFLICHDDVALAPDATRLLVEEAVRRNAGLASPKLVDWDHPDRLLAVGLAADKVGVVHGLVERGELDQQQHDQVRDIFVAPGAATLVRADLFRTLGGFGAEVAERGEDLDLSWRAHVAGARVVVVPAARVRHLEACTSAPGLPQRGGATAAASIGAARRAGRAEALTDQHRIRTLLCCYGWRSLVWVVPLVVVHTLGSTVAGLAAGHPARAARRLATPVRAVGTPGALWRARRRVQHQRRVPDREVRRLQSRGNARLRHWASTRWPGAAVDGLVGPGPPPRSSPSDGRAAGEVPADCAPADRVPADCAPVDCAQGDGQAQVHRSGAGWRPAFTVGALLVAALAVGSRGLLAHSLPGVGTIPDTSGGAAEWGRAWWSTWQPAGLGSTGPSPPALALLVLAAACCLGAVGTLQHVLVLGPLLIGPLGAYRAARVWGSPRACAAAVAAYALNPLAYNALAGGQWGGLLAYAAAPWVLGRLGRLSGARPFPPAGGLAPLDGARPGRSFAGGLGWRPAVISLGLLTALVGAFVPSFVVVVAVVGAGLALGSLLTDGGRAAPRLIAGAVGAGGIAFALLLPWSLPVATAPAALWGPPAGPSGRASFAELLRMHTGPFGSGPLGWGLLAAAALPLLTGRSWRLAWAGRCWTVLLVCVAWAWLGLQGRVPLPPPDVVLAPAAAALAACVALGAVAFEVDLPRYRLGWRQATSAVAAAGVALSVLPFLGATASGRWRLPSAGSSQVLAGEEGAGPSSGASRLLWIGAPVAIPLASWPLGGDQAWATSSDGPPDLLDQWAGGAPRGAATFERDIRLAEDGLTTDLGHLLAPLGVHYIVLPGDDAPSGSGAMATPTSGAVASGLSLQTDLDPLAPDANYTVYENAAWSPDVPSAHGPPSLLLRVVALLVIAAWAKLTAVVLDGRRRATAGPWTGPVTEMARRGPRWRRRRRGGNRPDARAANDDSDAVWGDGARR